VSEPEHFADVVRQNFPTLQEVPVSHPLPTGAPTLLSSEQHYARACALLEEADKPGTPISEVHSMVERARGHLRAAETAAELWPAYDGCGDCDDKDRQLEAWRQAWETAAELSRLGGTESAESTAHRTAMADVLHLNGIKP
jgi:hypothetical protein